MMATYRIEIPKWTPPRLNEVRGRHWSAEHKAKKRAAEMIGVYAVQCGVPKATGKRRVRLLVQYPRGKTPLPDADAFDKILLDSLVRAGQLVNDDADGLEGRMDVKIIRSLGLGKYTVITLEDVP